MSSPKVALVRNLWNLPDKKILNSLLYSANCTPDRQCQQTGKWLASSLSKQKARAFHWGKANLLKIYNSFGNTSGHWGKANLWKICNSLGNTIETVSKVDYLGFHVKKEFGLWETLKTIPSTSLYSTSNFQMSLHASFATSFRSVLVLYRLMLEHVTCIISSHDLKCLHTLQECIMCYDKTLGTHLFDCMNVPPGLGT